MEESTKSTPKARYLLAKNTSFHFYTAKALSQDLSFIMQKHSFHIFPTFVWEIFEVQIAVASSIMCKLDSKLLKGLKKLLSLKQQHLDKIDQLILMPGNGYISTDTLKEILKELDNKLSDSDLDGIIEEVDEDGSGTLDFDGEGAQQIEGNI